MITLADSQQYALEANPEVAAFNTPQNQAFLTDAYVRGTSQFGRGLRSAGLQEDVGFLADNANDAYRRGDVALAQALETQMHDKAAQAQQWAPTTQNFTDINSAGSAVDWATGSMGQGLRSTLIPVAGSLAGAGAGALTGIVTKNPGLGAKVGAGVGGFLGGYNMEANETLASAMMDPQIRANKTMQEIKDAGRVKGVAAGALEAVVPAMMVGKAAGLAGRVGKGDRLAAIGRAAGQGAITEFGTEAAQDLTGQATENYLKDHALGNIDPLQALNAGMAGAVAGGGMGLMGGLASAAHAKVDNGVEAVKDVAADPLGKAAFEAGKLVEAGKGKARDLAELMMPSEDALDTLLSPGGTAAQKDLMAAKHAESVMNDPAATPEDRAAAEVYAKDGDWSRYRDKMTTNHMPGRLTKPHNDIADEIAQRTGETSKSSMVMPTQQPAWDVNAKMPQAVPASTRMDIEAGILGDKSKQQQTIASVADIWRKQGVDEKLLSATSQHTDESQRKMAVSVLGWVSRGFKDADGNLFVPDSLTKHYGKKTPALIRKAVELAAHKGLIDFDTAAKLPEIEKLATEQHANATAVFDAVAGAMPESVRKLYPAKQIESFIPELRRMAQNGTTKKEEEVLLRVFGSKEGIANAMSKFEAPKGKNTLAGDSLSDDQLSASINEDTGVKNEDGVGPDDVVDTRTGMSETGGETTEIRTWNKAGHPYDMKNTDQAEAMKNNIAKAESHERRTSIGAVDRARMEVHGAELFNAENDLLDLYGADFLKDSEKRAMKEYGEGVRVSDYVEGLPAEGRAAILGKINERYRMLRVDQIESAAPFDAISKADIGKFEERGVKPNTDAATISHGTVFLERIDADGKTMTPFITSAYRLVRHQQKSRKAHPGEGDMNRGVGAQESYNDMLATIAALMEADSRFTGRVGYKVEASWAEPKWIEGSKNSSVGTKTKQRLPSAFQLVMGKIADAWRQQQKELVSGDKEGERIPFAKNYAERLAVVHAAITKAVAKKQDKYVKYLEGVLKSPKLVNAFYTDQRNRFQGSVDDLMNTGSRQGEEPIHSRAKADSEAVAYQHKLIAQARKNGRQLPKNVDQPVAKGQKKEAFVRAEEDLVASEKVADEEVQHSYRREDPQGGDPIHRDQTGAAAGLGAGAEGGGYGGNTRGGTRGGKPAEGFTVKARRVGATDDAKQWIMTTIKKGLPAFNAELAKLSKDRFTTIQHVLSEAAKMGQYGIEQFFRVKGEEALTMLKRVREAATSVAVEQEEAEAAKAAKAQAKSAPTPVVEPETDPVKELGKPPKAPKLRSVLAFIKKHGGIDPKESLDLTGDTAGISNRRRPGLFKKGGMSADALRELLHEDGWIADSIEEARDLIGGIYAGEDIVHPDDVEAYMSHGEAMKAWGQGHLFNAQTTGPTEATKEQIAAAKKHILDTLGDTVIARLRRVLGENGTESGRWTPGLDGAKNIISLALNSDVLSTSYHETMHEFFNILSKHKGAAVQNLLTRVATQGIVMRRMENLLAKEPAALAQLKNPEEAAAYMYQFWSAGLLKLGPQTTGFFESIKQMFRQVAGLVSKEIRDQLHAEHVMRAFSEGQFKDSSAHEAAVRELTKTTEAHDKALAHVGAAYKELALRAGKYVYSAEGMMEATKNKHVGELATLFNQKAGAPLKRLKTGTLGSYFDAYPNVNAVFQNKFENIIEGLQADELELVREALATDTVPALERIAKVVTAMKGLNDEMMDYIEERNISRLNDEGKWEPVKRQKKFGMPQIWDRDAVAKNREAVQTDLLKHHMKELTEIAKQANGEIKAVRGEKLKKSKAGDAARNALDKDLAEVTPEMVAEAIVDRIISTAKVDITESVNNLGISPLAASVNKRSLWWIDAAIFDQYKDKDFINAYSSYIASMTKRGEFTARFGNGGENIRDIMDRAFLSEMADEFLVAQAEENLPAAKEAWNKAKAADPDNFAEPYPTLRSVGNAAHLAEVGEEKFNENTSKAAHNLSQAVRAVQGLEGTLGIDISNTKRTINSALITYQSVRLLSTSLFTSLNDVIGLTLNGGTLNDAWEAFVTGMREVKLSAWDNSKSKDGQAQRAEVWGTVDAATYSDALGQAYGSMYLSGKAKAFSDKFFRKIGMEGWNRGMRIAATAVGERIITDWAKGKVDMSDKAQKARVERLFGAGADPSEIRLDAEGNLDIADPLNHAAMARFVNDSVLRPNASQRTIWGSDQNYVALWHLKSYTYTFHKVMLEAVLKQAALGNYRPALVAATGYMPVAIAAGAAKEMLIPGDEPAWMKSGLGGYMSYGFDRANLLGVPQMLAGNIKDPANFFGPTADEVQGFLSVPFFQDKTLVGETAGALPFGNIARRAVG
ncbi:MAG: hypothetical protein IPL32_17870 [Chloracidobacterium sp.]|nr:hypothetical protein [Chloracidobacterium sp.]